MQTTDLNCSVGELFDYGTKLLSNLSSGTLALNNLDTKFLLQYVLGKSFEELLISKNDLVAKNLQQKFISLLNRRINGEPLAYLIQTQSFYDLEFDITDDVLIPRSDTEELIDYILKNHNFKYLKILDLGTGSGCIIITLLKHLKYAQGVAIDLSLKALEVAQRNAVKIGVDNQITFLQSNWFDNIPSASFDIIVSNPPYISYKEKNFLGPEISYEPEEALFAYDDGLKEYKNIALKAADYLSSKGVLYLEIGFNQKIDVQLIFQNQGFVCQGSKKDIQGHDRCLAFTLK